jgi:hypothetical protein
MTRPIFYTTIIFGEILEFYYLETLKKIQTQNILLSRAIQNSLRTVGDSLKEHNPHPPFYLSVIIRNITSTLILLIYYYLFFSLHAYTLIIRHALCQTYVYMILERTLYFCKL